MAKYYWSRNLRCVHSYAKLSIPVVISDAVAHGFDFITVFIFWHIHADLSSTSKITIIKCLYFYLKPFCLSANCFWGVKQWNSDHLCVISLSAKVEKNIILLIRDCKVSQYVPFECDQQSKSDVLGLMDLDWLIDWLICRGLSLHQLFAALLHPEALIVQGPHLSNHGCTRCTCMHMGYVWYQLYLTPTLRTGDRLFLAPLLD